MVRDKIGEIEAMRTRGRSTSWRGGVAVESLQRQWGGGQATTAPPAAFVVISLVTALEVFTRDWVRLIIDSGQPYIGRAAELVKGGLKLDFAVAQALVGKQVTFGDLVAHELPVSSVGDIDRVFTALLNAPLFKYMENVVDRYLVAMLGEPPTPIFTDATWTRMKLARLFELRHIFVHELPDESHIEPIIVSDFCCAASMFCRAADQAFSTLLHGAYPFTQYDMNQQAAQKADKAKEVLSDVLKRLEDNGFGTRVQASQEVWEVYRDRQAEFRSGINELMRGSIAPLLYASEIERITQARIVDLEWYLNREEGDL